MIRNDDVDSQRGGMGDFFEGYDPVVYGYDQRHVLFCEAIHRAARHAISLGKAVRNMAKDIHFQKIFKKMI